MLAKPVRQNVIGEDERGTHHQEPADKTADQQDERWEFLRTNHFIHFNCRAWDNHLSENTSVLRQGPDDRPSDRRSLLKAALRPEYSFSHARAHAITIGSPPCFAKAPARIRCVGGRTCEQPIGDRGRFFPL